MILDIDQFRYKINNETKFVIKNIVSEQDFNEWITVLAINFGFTADVKELYKTKLMSYTLSLKKLSAFWSIY